MDGNREGFRTVDDVCTLYWPTIYRGSQGVGKGAVRVVMQRAMRADHIGLRHDRHACGQRQCDYSRFVGAAGVSTGRQCSFIHCHATSSSRGRRTVRYQRNRGSRVGIAYGNTVHGIGDGVFKGIRAIQSGRRRIGKRAIRVDDHYSTFCRRDLQTSRIKQAAIGLNNNQRFARASTTIVLCFTRIQMRQYTGEIVRLIARYLIGVVACGGRQIIIDDGDKGAVRSRGYRCVDRVRQNDVETFIGLDQVIGHNGDGNDKGGLPSRYGHGAS